MRTWRCDHPHTPQNTRPDGYCKTCRREQAKTPEARDQRQRYELTKRLDSARRKVAAYEAMARRLGMEHLL